MTTPAQMTTSIQPIIRLATTADIDVLVQMRYDFTMEDYPELQQQRRHSDTDTDIEDFHRTCSTFLESAINGGEWFIWVAEADGQLVSHMYLQLIHKVPRPGKCEDPYFGYVTNVYTRPAYRGRGIGTQIHHAMEQWAIANNVEFLILWPSETSVAFYERSGFRPSAEALEKHW
ncbi:RimJ/RimL family protein N-acetyltransferase [Paenibacillus taihuensis]|uniref:RimJ/RimL family protein N-acetyltransferase n=1 Tax=Paenibacillus taihuensis TaxID=1156355 RepID=A0A3D9S178_9BACL|nr:GNAT family N-acetyltransferase [Paenibacillus taihuensis]REE86197.1 RimJ/RimL family protein N-acetyltransferase [Paenibacillus taihuensis]